MHDTLLIKTVTADSTGLRNIFFQIGEMDEHSDKLMDLFNRSDSPYAGRCLFRFNGIRVTLYVEEIPTVLALLVKNEVPVYSVYEPYF